MSADSRFHSHLSQNGGTTATATPADGTTAQSAVLQQGGAGPAHILTLQQPLTASMVGNNFSQAGKYLNYAITDVTNNTSVRAAGIKAGFYFDIHALCQSNNFGACLVGMVTTPESAFEHTCDGTNSRITDTHSGGVTQFVTDATSSGIRQVLANTISYFGSKTWDFGLDDDAQDMSEISPYYNFVNYNTGAPQNPAPYCNFNESTYLSGMQAYYASSSIPIIANSLMPSGSSSASNGTKYFNGAAPLIGGMLEGAYADSFNGPDRYKESGMIWQSEENSELATANANRLFVAYEHLGGTDATGLDERTYTYASLMLGFSLNSTVLAEDGTAVNSGVYVNPEALLVPTSPLVSEPSNISSLQKNGGAYVREFANCYYNGNSIGACASVVNSNASSSVSMPALSRSYAHTAVISGAGVVSGVDSGSVNVNGPSAPSTIQAKTAYILVQ